MGVGVGVGVGVLVLGGGSFSASHRKSSEKHTDAQTDISTFSFRNSDFLKNTKKQYTLKGEWPDKWTTFCLEN